ncbi:PP2C family protein-serine/threonine phosphatase [Streptomyces cadmiisoli]|uniref:PP2C family protein-serine/threonine phosphatase n=1 Tax=Streptomyces cadmiisoli TaxID=2184053 RepID=UPI001FE77F62|nr:GAF domain-containing SpoIIE family protein phosphatase [Streptomyces cadmiisoli]
MTEGSEGVPSERKLRLGTELAQIAEQLVVLARGQNRLHELYEAVISRDQDLSDVLELIVRTAMDLVGARYGALGVLDDSGERLREFIPMGLSEAETRALAGVGLPAGRGLLGYLISHPEPVRVEDISAHPASVGFPPGHPPMHGMVGAAVSIRGRVYGNLYLCERHDGRPFDSHDEAMIASFAEAAGLAIDDASLMRQTRMDAEQFQRMLLPRLTDLHPFRTAAVYRPATRPRHIGGDWYDAVRLPGGAVAAVIGDVVGHDLQAAAAMAQTRNMLLALLHNNIADGPADVLSALESTVEDLTANPVTTVCLAYFEPVPPVDAHVPRFRLRWSTAGHPPPLLLTPDGGTRYLAAQPDLPLGVDAEVPRREHTHPVPPGSTVIFYTDGVTEHPDHPLDQTMARLAALAGTHADLPLEDLIHELADQHPSDGHDDMALLAVKAPSWTQADGGR